MTAVVRAGALQGFDDLVRRCGDDPVRLRRRRGLACREAAYPEAMVCLDSVAWLLEDAAISCARPDLGLRLGSTQNPSMLGLLAIVVQGAETAGAALLDSSRYLFMHSPNYQLVLESSPASAAEGVTLRFDVGVAEDVPYRQLIDGCLASLLALARGLSGIPIVPRSVSLPHTPAATRRTYENVFGAPVAFEQPKAALHLDPNLLAAKLHAARPEIRRRALAYIVERYPPTDATTTTQVRNALGGTIGATRGTKGEIARLFGLHPRTLQRRLEAEGTSFESIRDEVYRAATLRLLTETTIPLGQVAHALGFSEHSAMSRKVKHWRGSTPSEIRAARHER